MLVKMINPDKSFKHSVTPSWDVMLNIMPPSPNGRCIRMPFIDSTDSVYTTFFFLVFVPCWCRIHFSAHRSPLVPVQDIFRGDFGFLHVVSESSSQHLFGLSQSRFPGGLSHSAVFATVHCCGLRGHTIGGVLRINLLNDGGHSHVFLCMSTVMTQSNCVRPSGHHSIFISITCSAYSCFLVAASI